MPRPQPIALALHAISAYIMYWGFSSIDAGELGQWIRTYKGRHLVFLTIQGLWIAGLTMVVSLLAELFPSKTALANVKRGLLMVSLPLGVTISSIYWALIILFPRLIMIDEQKILESPTAAAFMKLPLTVDLALHIAPAVALMLDFFFFEKRYTNYQVARVAPLTTILFALWYVGCVEYFASQNGRFPYPFLEFPYYIRASVYIGAMVLANWSFRFLNWLHS